MDEDTPVVVSDYTANLGIIDLGSKPTQVHRSLVYDSLDQRTTKNTMSNQSCISLASTVDVDNTSAYLKRYADIYVHEDIDCRGITFIKVKEDIIVDKDITTKSPSTFKERNEVVYTNINGSCKATIMAIHYDDELQPYYTIKLPDGREKQTDDSHLSNPTKAPIDSDPPLISTDLPVDCVNFDNDPTHLFQYIYSGNWTKAHDRLNTNPEEASRWVARFGKGDTSNGCLLRWKLLPLHLCIALAGSNEYEDTEVEDVPHDEVTVKTPPPIQFFVSLLNAHPQATKCADDQGMIPLHSAIRGHSSLVIIEKLIEADPASVLWKDERGRDAVVLTQRVFKRIDDEKDRHKKQQIIKLLSEAASRASLTAPKGSHDPSSLHKRMQKLLNDSLILSRNNALLRHRATQDGENIKQLRKQVQSLQEQRALAIENYNEIFGNKDELDARRVMILQSLSKSVDEGNTEEKVTTQSKGNGGAFSKRLEKYHSSPITKSTTEDDGMTEATDIMTPLTSPSRPSFGNLSQSAEVTVSQSSDDESKNHIIMAMKTDQSMNWETRCRVLELESYDDDDDVSTTNPSDEEGTEVISRQDIFRTPTATEDETKSLDVSTSSDECEIVIPNGNTNDKKETQWLEIKVNGQVTAEAGSMKVNPDNGSSLITKADSITTIEEIFADVVPKEAEVEEIKGTSLLPVSKGETDDKASGSSAGLDEMDEHASAILDTTEIEVPTPSSPSWADIVKKQDIAEVSSTHPEPNGEAIVGKLSMTSEKDCDAFIKGIIGLVSINCIMNTNSFGSEASV
eukprot:scaffold358_cov207-Alexandrium_tamarense.AAC.18